MPSTLSDYSVREQLCVHTLVCMSMDMDWQSYEGKFIDSRLSQLTIASVPGYDVIKPNKFYMESLRDLPKSDKNSSLSIARRLVALSMRDMTKRNAMYPNSIEPTTTLTHKTEINASHSNSIQSPLTINLVTPASTSTPHRRSNRKKKPTKRFHSPGSVEGNSPKKRPVSRNSVIIQTEYPSHEIAGPSGRSSTSSVAQIQSVNCYQSSDCIEYESSEEEPVPQNSVTLKAKHPSHEIAGPSGRSSKLSPAQIQSINENNKRLLSLGKLLREKKTIQVNNQPKANLILSDKDAKKLLQNRNVRHSRIEEFTNINPNRPQPNPSKVIDVHANNAKKESLDEATVARENREEILELARKFGSTNVRKRFYRFMGYEVRTEGRVGIQRFLNYIANIDNRTGHNH